MALKCLVCGHLFEDGEQAVWEERHGLDAPPYERFNGCPVCRGDYDETKPCVSCGSEYTDSELYEGWCEKCLREKITYDSFFEYCKDSQNEHDIDVFVMGYLLGGMYCPSNVSSEFHQLMAETYKRRVADAKLLGEQLSGFLPDCICFIMDDDGSIGRDNFADWLNERGV